MKSRRVRVNDAQPSKTLRCTTRGRQTLLPRRLLDPIGIDESPAVGSLAVMKFWTADEAVATQKKSKR